MPTALSTSALAIALTLLAVAPGADPPRLAATDRAPAPRPQVPTERLYTYGDSFLAADAANTPGRGLAAVLDRRLPELPLVNRASSGSRMLDVALVALGHPPPAERDGDRGSIFAAGTPRGPRAWVPGDRGVVVVNAVTNDLWSRGGDPASLAVFEASLRTLLAVLTAGSATHAPATVEGEDAVVVVRRPKGPAVRVDGRPLPDDAWAELAAVLRPQAAVPVAVPLEGLGPGRHLVGVAGAGPRPVVLLPAAEPPTVVVVKGVALAPWAERRSPGGASEEVLRSYNRRLERVVADLDHPAVVVADPGPGWDPTTMLGVDGIHPNDRGMSHLASAVLAALARVEGRPVA